MFRFIVAAALRQRVIVLALSAVLIAYGAASLPRLDMDVLPDLNRPTVTIMTESPGMAPEEVEQQVTYPIERSVNGIQGVIRVRSASRSGLSLVYVEFDWDTDVYRDRQQVIERLSTVNDQLPANIVPKLSPVSSIMGEVMLVALSGASGSAVSPMALMDTANWVVRQRLKAVPGVSQVSVIGGDTKQYQVSPDPVRMNASGVTLQQLEQSLAGYSANTSGGYFVAHGSEYLVRHIGHAVKLGDLRALVVGARGNQSVRLEQVADVDIAPKVKRGDASRNGMPAVILSVQKQLSTDTRSLTRKLDAELADMRSQSPPGMRLDVVFRQADFIGASISNLTEALRDAAVIVTAILLVFLLSIRTTLISLVAIPLSIFITVLVFRYFGYSINTMTLGGLAIAIGELVDDAVVGVENVMRRLRQAAPQQSPATVVFKLIADATLEVRTAIFTATLIIVLVFVPLFALHGVEGRLFSSLGVAYIVSILGSMVVSMTVTPVLCYYLLPAIASTSRESPLLRWLKAGDAALLRWSFDHTRLLLVGTVVAVIAAAACVPFFPRTFLPPFNEGAITVNLLAVPGTSLAESDQIGTLAEKMLLEIPEVKSVGRRTGRAELDEHAEGVNYSELDVALRHSARDRTAVLADIRARLSALPVMVNIGQPISHRLDHLLSGIRAQLVVKIFGDDLNELLRQGTRLRDALRSVPQLVDLQVEQLDPVDQVKVRISPQAALQYGVQIPAMNRTLETLLNGQVVSQILDGNRRYDLAVRLKDQDRNLFNLPRLLVDTASGQIPLSRIAEITPDSGPNQIFHDNAFRRIAVFANLSGNDLSDAVQRVRSAVNRLSLPEGYHVSLEGQYRAREDASRRIAGLAVLSLLLIIAVVYSRYRSLALTGMILMNIPLALIGSVVALWVSGNSLSLASLIGFITLSGIATRNGLIKISHYINLVVYEGEQFGPRMIIRGSLERLAPVLMTALATSLALLPLLLDGQEPGKELLHPVAVVVFGGLISSTVLDTLLTPAMFLYWGGRATAQLLSGSEKTDRY